MGKFLVKFLLIVLLSVILAIIFLSYFGLETDKFDNLIKNKANTINKNINLEFNKTKIYLDIKDLKILLKLQKPKVLFTNYEIKLSKFNLVLSLKSFYKSNFALENARIAFEKNDIKDFTKISNIFIPIIFNQKINKIFNKGKLQGEFFIPFKSDGSIRADYSFYGKIKDAEINLPNNYKIKNLTAIVGYGQSANLDLDGLKITVEEGAISNLKLSGSVIAVKFEGNKKLIRTSINTKGKLDNSEIKNFLNILGFKYKYIDSIQLESNLKTTIDFDIDKRFKITNKSYGVQGDIDQILLKIKEKKSIKEFMPSFNPEIIFKNTKIKFSDVKNNKNLNLVGDVKFSDKFEKIKFTQIYNKKYKKYNINLSTSLDNSSLKIKKINYIKEVSKKAQIDLNAELILDKYFLINSLNYLSNKSEIVINKVKLNKSLQIIDLQKLKIKTYLKKTKNNDFTVIKSKDIKITGDVFDAQPLLKSLFQNEGKKTFSKKFNSDLKVNFKKTITGTDDDVSDLSLITSIKGGSFNKLSLKGNFSKSEIVEMSIYQIDNKKKTLQVISDRARPFIKHFEFIEGFEGGKLEYESIISNKISNSNLIITDFKVSKVPALAQLLTLASLQGIADTLGGEGIRFDTFEMKTNAEGNVINIEDALAMGPAVSILLEGYVDKGKIVSLRGTLVPATKLNAIIASIPLIGDILVGKKMGEGVVGVSFKMKGPPKDIKTTVNPIKTLTPRFIVRAIEKMKKEKKEEVK